VTKGCFTCGKMGVTVAHSVARSECHTVCHSHAPVRISVCTELSPFRQMPKSGVYKKVGHGSYENCHIVLLYAATFVNVLYIYIQNIKITCVYIYIYIYTHTTLRLHYLGACIYQLI